MKRVLLITYHFPPFAGSSGLLRPLTLTKYLPDFGWETTVLTIDPAAYMQRSTSQMSEIPEDVPVVRARGFDLKQKLSVLGHYPSVLAFPDRWNSWVVDGVRSGVQIINEQRPDVIFSTFPVATAHWIALRLWRKTHLPWVADFRDSMTEVNYPKERLRRAALRRFEKSVVSCADRVIFTAPGCQEMYASRYPGQDATKWRVVENGFDEATFAGANSRSTRNVSEAAKVKLILHSGILYPEERDPSAFLGAISDLKKDIPDLVDKLRVRFRATGHDQQIGELISRYKVSDVVELSPGIAYADAISEMCDADALLIFQAGNCNHQVPAKIYEYMRTGVPVIAFTDPAGDTARVLTERGFTRSIVEIGNRKSIYEKLRRFIASGSEAKVPSTYDSAVDSRYERARSVSLILDELC